MHDVVPSHGGWTPFHPMYENSTLCTKQMSLEHLSYMGSRNFGAFFLASPNKLSKKQSGYRLFQTPRPPRDVTVVCLTLPPDTGNLWPADVNNAGFPARGLLSQILLPGYVCWTSIADDLVQHQLLAAMVTGETWWLVALRAWALLIQAGSTKRPTPTKQYQTLYKTEYV